MGRDQKYNTDWTVNVRDNAKTLLIKVNQLIEYMPFQLENNPATGSPVSSGWRPARLNATVPGAAPRSKHVLGLAIDLFDPEGEIDDWCMDNLDKLEICGLFLEHPSATKNWCHLQCVGPKSGRRVFYP